MPAKCVKRAATAGLPNGWRLTLNPSRSRLGAWATTKQPTQTRRSLPER